MDHTRSTFVRPVIFLDIDGVLNHTALYASLTSRSGKTTPVDWLDRECVARLNTLCERSGADVVISSSWRVYLGGHRAVAAVLALAGFTGRVIDGTPVLLDTTNYGSGTRWTEIRAWLDGHPEVTRWVVIDDVDWPGIPAERFVRTNIGAGITDTDAAEAFSRQQPGS